MMIKSSTAISFVDISSAYDKYDVNRSHGCTKQLLTELCYSLTVNR